MNLNNIDNFFPGQLGLEASMLTIVLCCPSVDVIFLFNSSRDARWVFSQQSFFKLDWDPEDNRLHEEALLQPGSGNRSGTAALASGFHVDGPETKFCRIFRRHRRSSGRGRSHAGTVFRQLVRGCGQREQDHPVPYDRVQVPQGPGSARVAGLARVPG